jgi:hypothetical protein
MYYMYCIACIYIYIYGKGVKDKHVRVNSKCTHRQTHFRPKHLKRKQYLAKRPQSGLETKT